MMDDDPPIEPHKQQDFPGGVKVVDIGDIRVARGMTKRPQTTCKHKQLVYGTSERRIWCSDCEQTVDAFDAFLSLVEYYGSAIDTLARREQLVKDAEKFALRSRAAKAMDKAWRRRKMAPCCPHCHAALLPEDVVGGLTMMSVELVKQGRRFTPQDKV